jgi:hypothetical protein
MADQSHFAQMENEKFDVKALSDARKYICRCVLPIHPWRLWNLELPIDG